MKITLTTASDLNKSIKAFGVKQSERNDAIQGFLISAAYIALKYSNVDPFNNIAAIKGVNQHGIAGWVKKYAAATLTNGAYKLNNAKFDSDSEVVAIDADFAAYVADTGMGEDLWATMGKAASTPKDFDAEVYIDRVFKHLDTKGATGLSKILRAAKHEFDIRVHAVAAATQSA